MKNFDLSTRAGRYAARKAGLDVPKMRPGKPAKDFFSQIEKTDGCWNWLGEVTVYGYGIHKALGKRLRAHRHMLEHVLGQNIDGKVVMHMCDNRRCCNPDHLVAGTCVDNVNDMVQKKRNAFGEKNGWSKLKEKDVVEIREKYKTGELTYKQIGVEYGVCEDTIKKAVKGIYWGHVK